MPNERSETSSPLYMSRDRSFYHLNRKVTKKSLLKKKENTLRLVCFRPQLFV